MTALAAGQLVCECGNTDCLATSREATAAAGAVVHIVAHADTVEAAHADNGGSPPPDPTPSIAPGVDDTAPAQQAAAEPAGLPPAFCPAPAAFVIGGGVLPAPLLAAVLDRATVREIRHPGDAPPEPHYRPSRELADFVRCRDLTCRWPGCDKPAYGCDIDHTVPWPVGPTHASNTKCYCRFQQLLRQGRLSSSSIPVPNTSVCATKRLFFKVESRAVG